MSTLSRAIAIAAEAHAGQTDRGGQPYIFHPIRVMLAVQTDDERVVAILHDVLEDCPQWTGARLRDEHFPDHVVTAIETLTRVPNEAYIHYVRRCGASPLARAVKIADLRDNMDMSRLRPDDRGKQVTRERQERYAQALGELLALQAIASRRSPA